MEGSAITASNAVRGKLRFDTFSDFEAGLEIGAGANILIRKDEIGTPGKIRTYDLLLRRRKDGLQSFHLLHSVPLFFNIMGSLLSLS
jgi:hypothetical protein